MKSPRGRGSGKKASTCSKQGDAHEPRGRSHLSPGERSQIAVLLKRGDSKHAIGRLLERPTSTIRREIERNSGERGYRPKQAQEKSCERRSNASRGPTKMTPDMVALIETKLKGSQWSPEQISGWMKVNQPLRNAAVERRRETQWKGNTKYSIKPGNKYGTIPWKPFP